MRTRLEARQMITNTVRKAAIAAIALSALGGSAFAATPDFTGLWRVPAFVGQLKTTKGQTPPLQPAAAAVYQKRMADRAAGSAVGDPLDECKPYGVPRMMFAPYPMLVVQSAKQVSMVQQGNHTFRLIYVGGTHPTDPDPTWLGHSIAHWQGSTLVAETVGFNDLTWLDRAGLPHSDQMKVIERISLSKDGKTLSDLITIDDPKTFTAPWSTRVSYKRQKGMDLEESICVRNHKM